MTKTWAVANTSCATVFVAFIPISVSCNKSARPQNAPPSGRTSATEPPPNPERNVYFGEEHIHASWSMDAWMFGNHATDM